MRRSKQIYVYEQDRERLIRLAEANDRRPRDQFAVVVKDFCARYGLDLETCEPVRRNGRGKAQA